MLSIQIHICGMPFHFESASISYIQCFTVFSIQVLNIFFRFTAKYFTFWEWLQMVLYFKMSLYLSSLIYSNTVDFCMLILCPLTCWNSLVLGIFMCLFFDVWEEETGRGRLRARSLLIHLWWCSSLKTFYILPTFEFFFCLFFRPFGTTIFFSF